MDINQLKTFVAVAQSGGFASAAAVLDLAPSTVTRSVMNLERSIDVRLFQRTTRSVTLTEAGKRFLDRIRPALDEIDAAVESLNIAGETVSGNLRIAASVSFGQIVLAPLLRQFSEQYPETSVELMLSDSVTDIVSEGIDIAVRHGELTDSSLIAKRLCSVRYRLVAAPDYVRQAKKITHPRDIKNHPCLTYPYQAFRSSWNFTSRGKSTRVDIEPKVRISNAAALANCVKSAMGLSLLADWLVDHEIAEGKLVHILPTWTASGFDEVEQAALWLVTPSRHFVPAKTKAFMKYLKNHMDAN